MTERPILFSGSMVRALLSGAKTQTRRVIKPQPSAEAVALYVGMITAHEIECSETSGYRGFGFEDEDRIWKCPYGKPGDRLWVRETWQGPLYTQERPDDAKSPKYCVYAADGGPAPEFMDADDNLQRRWVPSIHMPRWASRITLEVTSVCVERLQDISEADAWAEGCAPGELDDYGRPFPTEEPLPCGRGVLGWDCARDWYADLWEEINGEDSWDANPWVWVVEFRRITP